MEVAPTPKGGSEKETLRAFLNKNRAVVVWKVDGVSDDDARRPMVDSGTSLIGLVKHLAWVERWWFEEVFAGRPVPDFPWTDADPDADLRAEPADTVDGIVDMYKRHVRLVDEIIDGATIDQLSAGDRDGIRFGLRWILGHMIEETARHAGHADILREMVDGSTGYVP